jgi:hypothetical protein
MIETLSTTQILGVIIGLYMVAAGIGLLTGRGSYATVIDELRDNTALGYLTSVFVFVLGAVIVAVHNHWTGPVAIVVSLVGWAALIEGVLMLAIRRPLLGLVRVVPFTAAMMMPFGIASIVFGALLLYAALF